MFKKKYAKQQQETVEKLPKLPEQNTKGLGMDFIQTRVITPLLPWDPTPPATTKREGIQKIRFL